MKPINDVECYLKPWEPKLMIFGRSPLLVWAVSALACVACSWNQNVQPEEPSDLDAKTIVEQALDAHGGVNEIIEAGVSLELEGVFDLTTRLQGRNPNNPEPTPIAEKMVLYPGGEELYYSIDWFNYYSSNQKLGEFYDRDGYLLFLDHRTQSGGYLWRETVIDAKERYARVLPNLLLSEALFQDDSLRRVEVVDNENGLFSRVSFRTRAGEELTISIDRRSGLVASVTSEIDMPLLGTSKLVWNWSQYEEIGGITAPTRFQITLNDFEMKAARLKTTLGVEDSSFGIPSSYDIAPRPDTLTPLAEFVPYGQRPAEVTTPFPSIYLVHSLRPGFQLFFVEFDDFVLAVDAPSGWFEMQQIPPMNWSHGDETSSLGEKYLQAIKQTVPDKPVKYLVLTHHHNDHIGGLGPFISNNTEILAGESAAQMVAISVTESAETGANVTVVKDELSIRNGSMEVQLIELPDGNPKADGYLMVYLPNQKVLYTTAFIYPVPESAFPLPESLELSLYFVRWLDESGLDVDTIYNVHAGGIVEDWQLERLRQIASERTSNQSD